MQNNPHSILRQYWGYEEFRPGQQEIINSVLEGTDTLAILPTGGGKSICFQIPALLNEGICLVISPLIALMKDQVEQLKKRSIPAIAIYSGLNNREIDIALDNCIYGNVKFLYLSPERLKTELFRERVKKMKVNLIAVDEAHCISQWGYDFRPSYLEIAEIKKIFPDKPVIALTASATNEVRKDIVEKLQFQEHKVYVQSFARANLSYSVFFEENKDKRLLKIARSVPGSSIVYVRNRKSAKAIAYFLQRNGISSDYYHAGLTNIERTLKQDNWIQGRFRTMVATNAFGMGIDKPDVRLVVNMDLPNTLEAYYQEAGRAGRDGLKSYAVLLYNQLDIKNLHEQIEENFPNSDFIRKVYQCISNYLKIAAGSSSFSSFDFDLDEFSKIYNLPHKPVYSALKQLEKHGLVEFNEAFYNPSRLYIKSSKEDLYRFQVANPTLDPLIKILLRIYGGELFYNYTPVYENAILKYLQVTASQLESQLTFLEKSNIISYDAQKTKPQIVFLTPRMDASQLPLDFNFMKLRKSVEEEKVRFSVEYASNNTICRSVFLSNYFGENIETKCGICDVCLEEIKNSKYQGKVDELQESIKVVLHKKKELMPEELVEILKKYGKSNVLECIRELIDIKSIVIQDNGKIKLFKDE